MVRSQLVRKIKGRKKPTTFEIINFLLMIMISIIMLYPFINVLSVSLSAYSEYIKNPLMIIPKHINTVAYEQILGHPTLWRSYGNTIFIAVMGTTLSLLLYIITAYPLTKMHLKGRRIMLALVLFTMLFNGGLIPNFLLIKGLGLYNNLWALILPMMFSAFNLFIFINYMQGLPESLEESAKMDGAHYIQILFQIIVPLCKPIIATIALFQAVGYWNNFFLGVVYIRDVEKWPLMLFLREIIMGASMAEIASDGNTAELVENAPTVTLQYATLMIVMIPIMIVYPFLQKYFVKGITLGSVKG